MLKHSKALIVAALALITLGLMLLDRTHITPDETPAAATNAPMAPDVTFTLLDGGTVALRSLAGHTVLLHFWASWCTPCRLEFSGLLERMAKDDGTAILLAVSGDARADDARTFLAPYKHDFKSLFDSGKVILAQDPDHQLIEGVFQTFQYPETIIIGPDLRMQRKIVGVYK